MVKYLPQFNWQPVVYTPQNPEFPSIDHSLEQDLPEDIEVIKTHIWEPYNIYRNLFGKKGETISAGFISENKKSGWKERLSIRIRGNFLIPDPRRFWVRPSVKFLSKYLKTNKIDAIITTGPPHSMHLIGLGLKKRFPNLTWIADFRDPWTNIDFYKDLKLSKLADIIHHIKEKNVAENADSIVVVSNDMINDFAAMQTKGIALITNGFDSDDFPKSPATADSKFSLVHTGLLSAARNPLTLWQVLGQLCAENSDFRQDLEIKLIGKTDFSVLEKIRENALQHNLTTVDYLTHAEAIAAQQTAQVLLLLINNSANVAGILTGKLYEYLAARRPILAIGASKSNVADILQQTRAGKIADFDDFETTKKNVLEFYNQFKTNALDLPKNSIEQYSRRNLAGKYAELLNVVSG
jgi:glycosyltransferase involved in cell wall biosynthesis